jgi:hypothetical protein
MAPNSRRVRWLSASNTASGKAILAAFTIFDAGIEASRSLKLDAEFERLSAPDFREKLAPIWHQLSERCS